MNNCQYGEVCYFYFCKNAYSCFACFFVLVSEHLCGNNWSYVFLVRSFGCALFVFKGGEEMKKELYSDPEFEIVKFSVTDVILTSPTADNDEDQGEWDEV